LPIRFGPARKRFTSAFVRSGSYRRIPVQQYYPCFQLLVDAVAQGIHLPKSILNSKNRYLY
jgi:hypothetical protein